MKNLDDYNRLNIEERQFRGGIFCTNGSFADGTPWNMHAPHEHQVIFAQRKKTHFRSC